ncbi:Cyclin N-terminal domain-containing protein [Mycena sanguinolenta]|uniref:Cyclin N-terminal domain-containing protein n=1 Tax=Mycena sanguinolenta TaxID=230812 RepID=A0A8H7DAQ7_9AGAR|nr:Cyclin N-terminal domain-containing protein [Mycena sanguinolenta]
MKSRRNISSYLSHPAFCNIQFLDSSSPVHPASLVDPSTHSPELMQLVDIDISTPVINYVVDCVSETVNVAFNRPSTFRSSHSRKFTNFVANVLSRAEVTPATLLVTLVYIARSQRHVSIAVEEWALERVFLGALILASKYTQDSTLRNVHWALVTGVFGKGDIGRIEREFLEVLDWELGVKEADVLAHHEGIIVAVYGAGASVLAASSKNDKQEHVEATRRAPSSLAVPELELSSPQSSAGSLSPRTPVSDAVDIEMDIAPSPTSTLVSPPHVPAPEPVRGRMMTPTKKSARSPRHHHAHTRRRLRDLLNGFQHARHQHNYAVEVAA